MNDPVQILTENIGEFLVSLVGQARDQLVLVAPFIKRRTLTRLLDLVDEAVKVTVVTRWQVGEICAGASDLGVFDELRDRQYGRLLLHSRLHAKLALVDSAAVMVGSANFTDAALGFSEEANVEAAVVLRPVPNRLFLFLHRLERECIPATEDLRNLFAEAVTGSSGPVHPTVQLPKPQPPGSLLFPRYRIPESLYRAYLSVAEIRDYETRAAVLHDLDLLNLPDGLNEPQFNAKVGAALLAHPILASFDEFVTQPRYFGEMADWLRQMGVCAGEDSEVRKLYLQTLLRWLLAFLPGRYRLETPNYSERFGRTDPGESASGSNGS